MDIRLKTIEAADHNLTVSSDAKCVMDSKENQRMVLSFFENMEEFGILENKNVTDEDIKNTMEKSSRNQKSESVLEQLYVLAQFMEINQEKEDEITQFRINSLTMSLIYQMKKFEWIKEFLENLMTEEDTGESRNGIGILKDLNMLSAIERILDKRQWVIYMLVDSIQKIKTNKLRWKVLITMCQECITASGEFVEISTYQDEFNGRVKCYIIGEGLEQNAHSKTEYALQAILVLEQIHKQLDSKCPTKIEIVKIQYDELMEWRVEVDQFKLNDFKELREKNKDMNLSLTDFNSLLLSKRFNYLMQGSGIKFSNNQKKMLVSDMNTIVLGRSGTGKTTISAFKILALDLLFMAYKKKFIYKRESFKLTLKDMQTISGCKTIFCTASPVLTNEVRKFYQDVIESIKKVLKFREESAEERRAKKSKENKEGENDEEEKIDTENKDDSDESFNAFEDTKEKNESEKLTQGLIASLEVAKQDILEDLVIEKQMTSYNRLKSIPKTEFPLFLTVKKLVYMLDGDCPYSFFSRNQAGQIYGMDASNEWHNESKEGALMINQYQRDVFDFDEKIKNIGKEMVAAQDMTEEQKINVLRSQGIDVDIENLNIDENTQEADDDYNDMQYIQNVEQYVQQQMEFSKRATMTIQNQLFSKEVNFEMFEKSFWGKNKGRIKLSAVNVWNEIHSVIKSST